MITCRKSSRVGIKVYVQKFYVLDVKISGFDDSQMGKLVKFDKTVSSADRSRFLEYLFKDANVCFVLLFTWTRITNIQMYQLYCLV